jgi:hypothetical protein
MATISVSHPVGKRYRTQQVTNLVADQQTVLRALATIPSSEGGSADEWSRWPPLAGPVGRCTDDLANAIWKFQSLWKARGAFHVIDGVVDPGKHTIAKMNELLGNSAPPGPAPAPPDPKTTAEANKPFASALVMGAQSAILKYALLGAGDDPDFRAKIDAALDHHFRFDQVADATDRSNKLDLIMRNYVAVQASFANSASIWASRTREEAIADNRTQAGGDPPPAYAIFNTYVRFSPGFRPWDAARRIGQGPYTAAMILIHESIHYCDSGAPDFAYEWQGGYDTLPPDQAAHNPSSYAAFAAEIRRGLDKPRPGAGNPSL